MHCEKWSGQGKRWNVCYDGREPCKGLGGCQRTWYGDEGVMVRGKWRGKVGDVEVGECEPGLKGWEDDLGAGTESVEEWRGQMRRCHEGPAVENGPGPLRASPRQPQPVFQTWGYVTTGEQGAVVRTGDSSMRGVEEVGVERRRRKGGEVRVWKRRGWGGARVQGQIVRRGKFHSEPLLPGRDPWVECNPCPGGRRNLLD